MLARQCRRVIAAFARITRARTHQFDNIFDLLKGKQQQISVINSANEFKLSLACASTFPDQLALRLNIPRDRALAAAASSLEYEAFSPISHAPVKMLHRLDQEPDLAKAGRPELPYSPGHLNLQYHHSIHSDVPTIEDYKLGKASLYLFNLPADITERKLLELIGIRRAKSVKLSYCLLGLPCAAHIEFYSENHLTERFPNGKYELEIDGRFLIVTSEETKHKLPVDRRQLVIKNLPEGISQKQLLTTFSEYGRVVSMNMPMEVYREPSLEEIKQLYKDEPYPITLNYYRKNGTIESEYYPPLSGVPDAINSDVSIYQSKKKEYYRRLKYCESVNVYEGEQGKTKMRSKGYSIVTFSCQEEAQHCYFKLRSTYKVEVVNGRDEFEFDERQYRAILRFVDNSYLDRAINDNPESEINEVIDKKQASYFKDYYDQIVTHTFSVHESKKFRKLLYTPEEEQIYDDPTLKIEQLHHHQYRMSLNEFKDSIGRGHINPNYDSYQANTYGKSFDELAEQELYGMKLKEDSQPRYDLNIEGYKKIQYNPEPRMPQKKERGPRRQPSDVKEAKSEPVPEEEQQKEKPVENEDMKAGDEDQSGYIDTEMSREKAQKLLRGQPRVKNSFSTFKQPSRTYRPKTREQILTAHIRYNSFIRDTINEYLGIFPLSKLESQFFRKKPTFTNPQKLTFKDGSDFLKQDEVRVILNLNTRDGQKFFNLFVKENEYAKSMNVDIEKAVLKNFDENFGHSLMQSADVGFVKEEYECPEENAEQILEDLKKEAEFGEDYRLVEGNSGKKIVKIAKQQFLFPLELKKKVMEKMATDTRYPNLSSAKLDVKFGQKISPQVASELGIPSDFVLKPEAVIEGLQQMGFTKKEIQKIMNLQNYSKEAIEKDLGEQMQVAKVREKYAPVKGTDFSRDPSEIKVKDRNKKAVVSKLRQI